MNVDPSQTTLIKIKLGLKTERDYVKIKFRRNPISEKLDMHEFKMDFFGNGKPYKFLLFVRNFNIMLESSRTLTANAKLQCICSLLHG